MQFAAPAILARGDGDTGRHTTAASHFTQSLSGKYLRRLQLAAQTEGKDAVETVCARVLVKLTRKLDTQERDALQTTHAYRAYELLADHYAHNGVEAEEVLEVCRVMWGQPYIAAIFSLLLHKWLLQNEEAGGKLHRHKHLNVALMGCRQLFWIDIHSYTFHFQSLFQFVHLSYSTISDRPFKNSFLPLIGQFLPYYHSNESLLVVVMGLPFQEQISGMRRPWMPSTAVGFTPDVLFTKITEMLKQLGAAEPGLVHYLASLCRLKGCPLLLELRTVTRLQFQAQLYSLTSQGGPRYPSHQVQKGAFSALDALSPAGARTRKLVSLLFKIFHPLDWPRTSARVAQRLWSCLLACVLFILSCFGICLRSLKKPFLK